MYDYIYILSSNIIELSNRCDNLYSSGMQGLYNGPLL